MRRSCPIGVSSALTLPGQDRARRVVARYAADSPTAPCPRSTKHEPLVCRVPPDAYLRLPLGPRPLQPAVDDVATVQREVVLEIERRPSLDAGSGVVARDDASRIDRSRRRLPAALKIWPSDPVHAAVRRADRL